MLEPLLDDKLVLVAFGCGFNRSSKSGAKGLASLKILFDETAESVVVAEAVDEAWVMR